MAGCFEYPSHSQERDMKYPARLFLLLAIAIAYLAPSASAGDPVEINTLYFLFHPCCWQMFGETPPQGSDPDLWAACYKRERETNEGQKKLISNMKADEALVLFPIGSSDAMREIEEHATKVLGRRCVVVRRGGKDPPREWAKLERPLQQFLDNPELPGRTAFLKDVPTKIRGELAAEIREAMKIQSETAAWNISVLEVIYYSRLCAMDIENELAERNLHYDPQTIRSSAFGEGFEQCAMTWKQMLVPYLGLKHPAENIFELSVSGAPWLVNAKLHERIDLGNGLRLFLWENVDGRKVAMYARASCRLKDPQLYASVPLADLSLEVREVHDKECWPKADGKELQLHARGGHLRVPVFSGIRRDFDWRATVQTDEEACYLIADNVSLADFRKRLVTVEIGR
jgi:hypothetical protein